MTRLLALLALLFARRALADARRLWRLYTADRAPIFPQPSDYVPGWFTEVHR